MVLATDEVYTYAIFNYGVINWSAHTEAGGDTTYGEGGTPAFVSTHWNSFLYLKKKPVRLNKAIQKHWSLYIDFQALSLE